MTASTPIGGITFGHVRANPGDLIEFQKFGYSHWAVYVGNNMIIEVGTEYAEDSDDDPLFRKFENYYSSLADKQNECKIFKRSIYSNWVAIARVNNELDYRHEPLSMEEIVKRAESKVGIGWKYDLFTNNCEVFAKWCRYGIKITEQAPHEKSGLGHKEVDYFYTENEYNSMGLGKMTLTPNISIKMPNAYTSKIDTIYCKKMQTGVEIAQVEMVGVKASAGLNANIGKYTREGQHGVIGGIDVAQASVGPVSANLGLRVDTGITKKNNSVGLKVLGTGVQIGRETEISLLGSSLRLKFW